MCLSGRSMQSALPKSKLMDFQIVDWNQSLLLRKLILILINQHVAKASSYVSNPYAQNSAHAFCSGVTSRCPCFLQSKRASSLASFKVDYAILFQRALHLTTPFSTLGHASISSEFQLIINSQLFTTCDIWWILKT